MDILRAKRKGESLLETIIAIAILIVGTVSMLAMVFAMLIARTAAEYETVGTNLAREGIEAVRNVRDTNWIANIAFDSGFYSQSRFVASFDPSNSDGLHPNGWRLAPASLDSALAVKQFASGGTYAGFYTQVGTGETAHWPVLPTIYSRTIYLMDICNDGTIQGAGSPCPAGTSAGVNVTSVVNWSERGRPHSVTLVEKIYDWR
jgi:type II secretory pathway pseudopilin PulG